MLEWGVFGIRKTPGIIYRRCLHMRNATDNDNKATFFCHECGWDKPKKEKSLYEADTCKECTQEDE